MREIFIFHDSRVIVYPLFIKLIRYIDLIRMQLENRTKNCLLERHIMAWQFSMKHVQRCFVSFDSIDFYNLY